jgi:hypothetical protein
MVNDFMVNDFADARPVYTIDALDRIVYVNPAWSQFVASSRGDIPGLPDVFGQSIWDRIPGGVVRQLWELLYSRVRAVGASMFVPMRVDRPDERRLVDIELQPLSDGSIRHICEPVWRESRPAVALLDPSYPRDERTLLSCAWCRRIQVRLGLWEEIEDAQQTLAIPADSSLPRLEPGACTTCKQSLLKTFPARVA